MGFSLVCPCGQELSVQPAQAGTTIVCGCGARVQVPSLSGLRERAGQAPFEAGTIDQIYGMLERGELPAGSRCVVCGEPTEGVVDLLVEAERTFGGGDNRAAALLTLFLSPIFLLALLQKPRPILGRETIVPTPLRVAPEHHRKLRRAGQRELRRWLRSVPIYAKLLDEYPRARIKIGTSA